MKRTFLAAVLAVFTLELSVVGATQEKAIVEVTPGLTELGQGWTTNLITYLVDPLSHPPEFDFHGKESPELRQAKKEMKTNGRTGCAMMLYGRGNLVRNSGLYRVCIQRWSDKRRFHNSWTTWKMDPARFLRNHPSIGEDYFWTAESWRDTVVAQNLVFRRGMFNVMIQAGAESDVLPMLRLAEVIDAKIRGQPVPPAGSIPKPN